MNPRYVTDSQIGTVARSFRQCAPLIATAESLRFLVGGDLDAIVGPLRTDIPTLARLKSISRWLNGNPFMLAVDADLPMVFVSDLVSVVYEYLNLAFLLDATGISFGVKHFSRHGRALIRVTAAAGDVDAAISVASFRASRADWTRPEFRAAETAVEFSERRYP